MKDGGTLEAWLLSDPRQKIVMELPKIEGVAVSIAFCSSEEPYEEAKYAIDNDPSTYWHSMYSVTVAQYPHWIDLDTKDLNNIRGLVYIPRNDSDNGNIKGYEIYVSEDGQNWGNPVASGEFANDRKKKRVDFTPVKGRYLRFKALNSQNGQDYASAAEIQVLCD